MRMDVLAFELLTEVRHVHRFAQVTRGDDDSIEFGCLAVRSFHAPFRRFLTWLELWTDIRDR